MPFQASDVSVNVHLSNIAADYANKPGQFVAGQVFPVVPVVAKAGSYRVLDRADEQHPEEIIRSEFSEAKSFRQGEDTGTYICQLRSAKVPVSYQSLHQAAQLDALNGGVTAEKLREDASRAATAIVLQNREFDFRNKYFKTGVWANDLTGVTGTPGAGEFVKLSDTAGNFANIVRAGKELIRDSRGLTANTLVLSESALEYILMHGSITSAFDMKRGAISLQMLKELLNLDRIITSNAIYNSAARGAIKTAAQILTKNSMLLCYTTATPSEFEPSAGYNFVQDGAGLEVGMGTNILLKNFDVPRESKWEFEANMAYDQKLADAHLGAFFTDLF